MFGWATGFGRALTRLTMPQVSPGCRVTARSASLTLVNLRGAPNPTY